MDFHVGNQSFENRQQHSEEQDLRYLERMILEDCKTTFEQLVALKRLKGLRMSIDAPRQLLSESLASERDSAHIEQLNEEEVMMPGEDFLQMSSLLSACVQVEVVHMTLLLPRGTADVAMLEAKSKEMWTNQIEIIVRLGDGQ